MRNREEILNDLVMAVINMDEDTAKSAAEDAISCGIAANVAITEGLVKGMQVVGEKYEKQEYFIPQVLLCSDAMIAGIEVLRRYLPKDNPVQAEKVLLGVVQGDTHDIGKNLVKIMLETSGFEVVDLGRDVPPHVFAERAKRENARLVGLSTLMTTTMKTMAEAVRLLKEQSAPDGIRIMIGGEPTSQAFADRIGAHGYAATASGAANLAKKLTGGIDK